MTDVEWQNYTAATTAASGDDFLVRRVSVTPPADGTVERISASDLATALAAIGSYITTSVTNVSPSGDTSGATDYTNIQAAINSSAAMAVLVPGTYYTYKPLSFPGGTVIAGAGRGTLNSDTQTVIKATASMDAVLASSTWLGSGTTSAQAPVTMTGFMADGNNLATHGIVSQNWDSLWRDVFVRNVSGDGFRLDAYNQAQTLLMTGTGVNHRFLDCSVSNCGQGFSAVDTSAGAGSVFTDGYMARCVVSSPSGAYAVTIDSSGDWLLDGCHVYGLSQNGIRANATGFTGIVNCFVEAVGGSATAGTYYGIQCYGLVPSGSVIAGNRIWQGVAPGNSGSTIIGIQVKAANDGSVIPYTVTGNTGRVSPSTGFAAAYGIQWAGAGSSSVLTVETGSTNLFAGNWTAAANTAMAGGTLNLNTGGT